MHADRPRERRWLRRLRWRTRGARQWPAFTVLTLGETALLHWLPLAGDGTGWVPALLLAGCLNLLVVAALGPLGGRLLRRRRPDLPRVVADDTAGTVLLAMLAGALLAIGLAHRPEVEARRAAFAEQSAAVREWVAVHGDAFQRTHVNGADTLRLERDLYRTCVPGIDPKRWLCLIVDTSASPPRVKHDFNREPNASLARAGGFR
ncbi:MAG: hypothetical protein M3296_06895 [Actinomycetota bacterium]|nr:hypothetical protein [Actinomycetota bacterium]